MNDKYRFKVLGPFGVPVDKNKYRGKRHIDFEIARDTVFEEANNKYGIFFDIKKAVGCYVFGLSPSGSARRRAYYVGKACEQTLFKRVFQPIDKPDLYNDILNWYQRATPFVFLLPLLTPTGKLAKLGSASSARRIDLAEHDLIGMALRSNPDLWNIQHRVAMESFFIEGTPPQKGRRTEAANNFSAMLNLSPPKKGSVALGNKLPSPEYIADTEADRQSVKAHSDGNVDLTNDATRE